MLFEQLCTNFKGPLPSQSKNHYILSVIDKYSRLPCAFKNYFKNRSWTFINHLTVFGLLSYIHADKRTCDILTADMRVVRVKYNSFNNS